MCDGIRENAIRAWKEGVREDQLEEFAAVKPDYEYLRPHTENIGVERLEVDRHLLKLLSIATSGWTPYISYQLHLNVLTSLKHLVGLSLNYPTILNFYFFHVAVGTWPGKEEMLATLALCLPCSRKV